MNFSKAICVCVDVLNSWKSTVTSMVSWCIISLINRLVSSFLFWFHVVSIINIWSSVTHLSLRWWPIWVLGIEYELLPIVS